MCFPFHLVVDAGADHQHPQSVKMEAIVVTYKSSNDIKGHDCAR
jgi:hypothetical protein